MRHTGIKIFLLLLFLVMILCAIIIIRDPTVWPFGKEGQGISLPFIRQTQSTPTPAPAPEKTPESAAGSVQQPAAEKPAATAEPAPATPQPTPTPTPAPTPEPYGMVLSSGTISSGKPWLINIHADWVATTSSESQAEVEVVAYADHFALTYGSTESLHITLGEKSVLLSANAIDSKINDKSQATELGRKTFTVPLKAGESVSLPLEVSWDFEGMYVDNAGNYFDVHGITSEGTVSINR